MRIISGNNKGAIIKAPAGLPVRPTTDRAKESLFNILSCTVNFNEISVLDLFSGTGNIAYEFASRGAKEIICVDIHHQCIQFIKQISTKFGFNIKAIKSDAFAFIKSCNLKFDIIFADAPYALPAIKEIPYFVQQKKILKHGGLLIIEHASSLNFSNEPSFAEVRKYGQSSFSFFKNLNHE
ncbi:MAG: RsmD family RNA methyltransferase [Bacteroidia bacterium]